MREDRNALRRRGAGRRAGGLLAGLLLATSCLTPAMAEEWDMGGVKLKLNSTLSAGMGIRTVNPDSNYIGVSNGGTDPGGVNFDDGNLNYKRGDIYSASVRMMHEVDVSYQNLGAFTRFSYFYDFVNSDADSTRRTDLTESARHRAGRGVDLYDAYVFGDFEVGNSPLNLRLGNQVINWGEALFRTGGIAQTNALDVARVVTPGTNIREAYLPSPMIYANFGIVPGLSVEAYYQFQWRRSKLLPMGTFFSTDDLTGPGAEGLFFAADPGGTGLTPEQLFLFGAGIPKLNDVGPKDQGQFGLATRYYVDPLSAEISAFYLRYHAKTPYLSATAIPLPFPVFAAPTGYFAYFPENIDLYGASVSLPVGPLSVAAEVAYQPDYPVMLADAVTAAVTQAFLTGLPATVYGVTPANRWNAIANAALSIGPGLEYLGQTPGWIGADTIDLIGEVGAVSFSGARPAGVTGDMFAWGTNLAVSATYTNAFGTEITLKPGVSIAYDVNGVAIDRASAGTYIEGKRSLTVGLTGVYRDTLTAAINYTNSTGGGTISRNSDRDYVTLTASYSF